MLVYSNKVLPIFATSEMLPNDFICTIPAMIEFHVYGHIDQFSLATYIVGDIIFSGLVESESLIKVNENS